MSEKRLTFEEFISLPRAEQNKRIYELSNHDRFLARMNDWGASDPDQSKPKHWPPTEEEWQKIIKIAHGETKK